MIACETTIHHNSNIVDVSNYPPNELDLIKRESMDTRGTIKLTSRYETDNDIAKNEKKKPTTYKK